MSTRAETAGPRDDRRLAAFRPLRLKTASDEVVAVLVDAIQGGLYEVGDTLPRERDLALRLQVSRTVVREAIATLRRAGVVSVRRGARGGVLVESIASVSSVLANLHAASHDDLRHLLETRRVLESTAALLVSERATTDDLADMEALVEALEGLLDEPEEFFATDFRFHLTLGERCGNPVISEYQLDMGARLVAIRSTLPVGRVDLHLALANQRHTMAALNSRRPTEIISSLDEHLAAFEKHILGERLRFVWMPG